MPDSQTARLFTRGRSQAVRLPQEFRFMGDRVRIRRTPEGVLLQPMIADPGDWFAEIDRCEPGDLNQAARNQPAAPVRKIFE